MPDWEIDVPEYKLHGYSIKILVSIAQFALESVLETGKYGFDFSEGILKYLKQKSFHMALFYAGRPHDTIEHFHNDWLATKLEEGWKYAPNIDNEKKTSKEIYPFCFLANRKLAEYKHFRAVITSKLAKYKETGSL